MFSVTNLLRRLREDEGFRSAPYRCSADKWTIGYGSTQVGDDPVTAETPPISISMARTLLKAAALDAIDDCHAIYGDAFSNLHSVHQEILICLAYQLGRARLERFKRMNAAIVEYDYEGWVRELLDSKLAHQASKRVARYVEAIRTAKWSWMERQ